MKSKMEWLLALIVDSVWWLWEQVGRKIIPKFIPKPIRNNIKSSYDSNIRNEGVQGRPGWRGGLAGIQPYTAVAVLGGSY